MAFPAFPKTTPDGTGDSPRLKHAPVLACLLLGLMAILAGGAAWRESVTFDEVAHIGAGLSYLQKLDLRFNEEHPPLAKVIAAVPLILRGTYADYTHVYWTASEKFVPNAFFGEWAFGEWVLTHWNDPMRTLWWARLPMLLLTLLLGWVVFACARKLGGDGGGLLALSAYVSTPTFITFGPLVLTDLAVTMFSLVALWEFAELWREPSRRNTFRFGSCLALALLTKFSSGLLFFAFGAFALSTRWLALHGIPTDKTELREWRRLRWRWTLKGTVLAAIIVYGFYFIFSLGQSTDALYLLGHGAAWIPVRRVLMPPWLYLRGLLMFAVMSSRPTFLFGHGYAHGEWFYFPLVFLLKSTLGFLGLLALALALGLRHRRRPGGLSVIPETENLRWRVLWVSLIVFAAACMLSRMTFTIRHFMIPIVLLTVMLAPLPRLIRNLGLESRFQARGAEALATFLAASSLAAVVWAYPNYFPFLNSLTRGRPIYWWVSDSNVDWNQSLPAVRRFADEHRLKVLNMDFYGSNDPTAFVPQARLWDCQQPAAEDANQLIVISSNMIMDGHNCAWLMHYPHQSLAGGSMWAVHLPPVIPPMGAPSGPPPADQRKMFLSMPQDMRVTFINLTRHPSQFSQYCAQIEAQMREYWGSNRKK